MATGDTITGTRQPDRYHVEISHPGREWTHIHHPDWETTTDLDKVRRYADSVEVDHPGSEVRIVRTLSALITTFRTGATRPVDLTTEVVDR